MVKNNSLKTKDRVSVESLVIGILSVISSIAFFLLIPNKPFGINILQTMDAKEDFTRYVFFLFLIMLIGVISIGTAVVSLVFGIKDFIGSYRGLYIDKGKNVYLAGAILGGIVIILFITFIILLNIL